jgi:S1-C subfamily serine protease
MGALEDLSAAVAKVALAAGPAVVGIGGRWRRGSGIVVGEGRVLTNAHNIHGDGATCVFSDGRQAHGRLLGWDDDGDLAVLEVDTAGVAPLVWAGAKAAPAVGSPVFAVASSNDGLRATFGFVSGVDRSFRGPGGRLIGGSVEHTAPLAPGSSGSPILDTQGRLLGLNTQRVGEGFYLALPADASLRARVDGLARGESPTRPRLGVAVAPGRVARHIRRGRGDPRSGRPARRAIEGQPGQARAGARSGSRGVDGRGEPGRSPRRLPAELIASSRRIAASAPAASNAASPNACGCDD